MYLLSCFCQNTEINSLKKLYSFQACSESVTSVQGAVVGNAGYEEIVASTYTGELIVDDGESSFFFFLEKF